MLAVLCCDHTNHFDRIQFDMIKRHSLFMVSNGFILKPLYNYKANKGAKIVLYDLDTNQITDVLEYDPDWSILPDNFYSD